MAKSISSIVAGLFALTSRKQNKPKPENLLKIRENFIGKWKLSPRSKNTVADDFFLTVLTEFYLNADSTTHLVLDESGKLRKFDGTWRWHPEKKLTNNDIQIDYKQADNRIGIWALTIGQSANKLTLNRAKTQVYEKAEELLK